MSQLENKKRTSASTGRFHIPKASHDPCTLAADLDCAAQCFHRYSDVLKSSGRSRRDNRSELADFPRRSSAISAQCSGAYSATMEAGHELVFFTFEMLLQPFHSISPGNSVDFGPCAVYCRASHLITSLTAAMMESCCVWKLYKTRYMQLDFMKPHRLFFCLCGAHVARSTTGRFQRSRNSCSAPHTVAYTYLGLSQPAPAGRPACLRLRFLWTARTARGSRFPTQHSLQ